MGDISEEEIKSLLTNTEQLFKYIYWVRQEFSVLPSKEHVGTSIEVTDISQRRHDFLKELVNTVVDWVYSKETAKHLIDERLQKIGPNEHGNAANYLTQQAYSKFRPGKPQGQFGELLLFNYLQEIYKAVPLLRKQRITTNPKLERNGADAIHYRKEENDNILVIGEAKCYESKYSFSKAFKESLESIIESFSNIDKELDLYVYDSFIDKQLEDIAKKYKDNVLDNVKYELICLITYNETKTISGNDEAELKKRILETIEYRCSNLNSNIYNAVDDNYLRRINYIIFPIWELDELLERFTKILGLEV